MTLRILDTVRVGWISSFLPITSSSFPLSASQSSIKYAIPSRNTLASATRESSLVSVNRVMRSFTSHFLAHGACGLCRTSQPGGTTVSTSGLVRRQSCRGDSLISDIPPSIANCRLPLLADDSRTQALLSYAGFLLVPAAHRPRLWSRETSERLQGTRRTSPRYFMACWVRAWL